MNKSSVLFVCMGNICRSPTAEGVFRHLVRQEGLGDRIEVDSAGTHAYHVNEPADRRARAAAERRGYSLDEVESLSKALPERIGKGYLSRCENGRQRLAFSKMIALCRVYDVPSEVLLERMELDLELEDNPPPSLVSEDSDLPQVFLLSSGEMTPFVVTLSAPESERRFLVKANLLGQLELE